ncbi:hypothetical protein [Gulosibacter bifidus]|uniref:Uncharacterized protein n=1 Tax=Gulosibacter bifidus TaxID=272239 RepID=A0ABW5RIT0_9MICO|nr:hypothetical protein [Gulosibacter bifidus]
MQFTAKLETGNTFTVSPKFADKIAFEQYLANRNIGNIATNVFRMQAFCTWRAGKRDGHIDMTLDDFMNQLVEIDVTEAPAIDDEADDDAMIEGVTLGKDGLQAQQMN